MGAKHEPFTLMRYLRGVETIKFEISKDAKAYILENDGAIIVEMSTAFGWDGGIRKPIVYTGKPPDPENYNEFPTDDIKAYTLKGYFGSAQLIKINLTSRRGSPTLEVNRIE